MLTVMRAMNMSAKRKTLLRAHSAAACAGAGSTLRPAWYKGAADPPCSSPDGRGEILGGTPRDRGRVHTGQDRDPPGETESHAMRQLSWKRLSWSQTRAQSATVPSVRATVIHAPLWVVVLGEVGKSSAQMTQVAAINPTCTAEGGGENREV